MIGMNKRGAEKILSVWWVVMIVMVGVAIVAAVLLNYSADIDTRALESSVLVDTVSRCFSNNGFLIDDVFNQNFDVFAKCGLEKSMIEGGDFYFRISGKDLSGREIFNIRKGASSMEKDCTATENVIAEKYPKCASEKEAVLYRNGTNAEEVIIEVFAASNHKGENVPIAQLGK